MVWPFSKKKKIPKIPFPEGEFSEEGTLRFPEKSSDKIIEPEQLKNVAVGKVDWKEEKSSKIEKTPKFVASFGESINSQNNLMVEIPLFIKKDVYQHILGEVQSLKIDLSILSQANKTLENSEYNEEENFEKLRRTMKSLHDRLLQVDKILFKS